jgi:hypothetical protein
MREQWHSVKSVFEALSYIVKPMAPNGIELFYTVSYETWRRHNTSELGVYLEKKEVAGDTDISYRLGLQLQSYKAKIQPTSRKASAKSKKVRPMSFYILTDGNWKAGGDAKAIAEIKGIADNLINADLKSGQLAIQFISFGQNAEALQRMNHLANTDFGLYVLTPLLVYAYITIYMLTYCITKGHCGYHTLDRQCSEDVAWCSRQKPFSGPLCSIEYYKHCIHINFTASRSPSKRAGMMPRKMIFCILASYFIFFSCCSCCYPIDSTSSRPSSRIRVYRMLGILNILSYNYIIYAFDFLNHILKSITRILGLGNIFLFLLREDLSIIRPSETH